MVLLSSTGELVAEIQHQVCACSRRPTPRGCEEQRQAPIFRCGAVRARHAHSVRCGAASPTPPAWVRPGRTGRKLEVDENC